MTKEKATQLAEYLEKECDTPYLFTCHITGNTNIFAMYAADNLADDMKMLGAILDGFVRQGEKAYSLDLKTTIIQYLINHWRQEHIFSFSNSITAIKVTSSK